MACIDPVVRATAMVQAVSLNFTVGIQVQQVVSANHSFLAQGLAVKYKILTTLSHEKDWVLQTNPFPKCGSKT